MMPDPRNVPGVAAAHPQIRLILIERLADGAACGRPHDFLLLLGEPLARLHLRLIKREDRDVVRVGLVVRDTGSVSVTKVFLGPFDTAAPPICRSSYFSSKPWSSSRQ
jgi:hypothetical protein